jgi:hypothetical protein
MNELTQCQRELWALMKLTAVPQKKSALRTSAHEHEVIAGLGGPAPLATPH